MERESLEIVEFRERQGVYDKDSHHALSVPNDALDLVGFTIESGTALK
ncbi:MAG: hypothetical protein R3B51_03905 [Thermodesulfobacteriota bacterium]